MSEPAGSSRKAMTEAEKHLEGAPLPIYLLGQGVLRRKARPVKGTSPELVRFAADMVATMRTAEGVGLAANQVGDLRRIIVVDTGAMDEPETDRALVLLNPEIIEEVGECTMPEGCLSIPNIREEVTRPETIRVRYRDLEFTEQVITADGLLSRVIQHELDHINGVLFVDRLNIVKRKLLRGRLNKIQHGEVEVEYPVVDNEVSPAPRGR
jgi:peptide deformylase